MEFTELADYPLPEGFLTEWTPRIDDDSAAWQEDDRPLAYTHEAHCRHSMNQGDDHSPAAWIGAAFRVPDHFDPAAVRRALRAWTGRHETFRTTVVEDSDGRLGRRTVPGQAVDVGAHTHRDILTGTKIHDHLANFFGTRLSPFRWPHCLVATVHDPDGDGFLLVFGADHSVMDAYSMLLAVSELRRLYEYEVRGTDPLLAEIGSHVDFSALDRRLGDALTPDHPAVRLWSTFLHAESTDGARFPEFPLPLTDGDSTASPRQSSLSSWLLSDEQTDRLGRHCRESGHGLQAGVLAALAITARSLTGDEAVRFAMPMHTRFEPRYAQSVGWYVGVVPIEIDLHGADTVDRALASAAAAVDRTKGMARLPYSKIADILQVTSTPKFVVSYLDLRHTPDASNWSTWQARTLRGSTDSPDEVYFWILRTPLGLNVSARFPSHETATTNVHRFVAALSSQLARLAEGGVSASTGSDLELSAR